MEANLGKSANLTIRLYRLLWVWDHLPSVVESAVQAGRISTFHIVIMHLKYRESASTSTKPTRLERLSGLALLVMPRQIKLHLLPLLIF